MELLDASQHLTCKNYEGSRLPVAEALRIPKGEIIDKEILEAEIVFIMDGKIHVSYDKVKDREMGSEQILLIPGKKGRMTLRVDEDLFVMVCRLRNTVQLCEEYSMEKLGSEYDETENQPASLKFNEKIRRYLDGFVSCVEDGLRCSYYLDIKIKELFYLLSGYYPKKELAAFFRPLMNTDSGFSNFVWKNYRDIKTVAEFARLSKYSLSAFKGKFKNTFGISVLQWMNEQKARNVHHDLTCSQKSLKEISDEYHFSSVSHLNTFCKEKFNSTPGQIRIEKSQMCKK